MELDKGADPPPPIEFRLDPASGVPTYLQLVQQVEQALRMGWLTEGDRLPRVREVVAGLAINPNTVLKAYRELEHRSLAVGRRGQGTFVRGLPAGVVPLRERAALRRGLLDWMCAARATGLDEDGMVAVFEDTLRDLRNGEVAS
ncbi:GntR family transcriptional regulator [Kitasatospora sp. NPDC056731]|uniref:GntR family transcriptional regulator n=1 Tax=Kitasatospora sp. NPDC056731 TaxID=3155422 RepID=UPI00344A0D16